MVRFRGGGVRGRGMVIFIIEVGWKRDGERDCFEVERMLGAEHYYYF